MQVFKSKDKFLQFTLKLESSEKFSLKQGITTTNENTLEALKRFSMLERQSSKTFYLWGEKGSGKTFWLRSWHEEKEGDSVYIDSRVDGQFVPKKNNWFLYVDNIENADKRIKSRLFEELINQHITNNRFVFASRINLKNLKNLNFREDFISRLKQGLVYRLDELPDEEKKNALRVHIHNLGWIKSSSSSAYDSLIDYMLTHLPRELGTLRLALDKLNEVAVKQKRIISLRSIKHVLEEYDIY
ncbi:hypothetical protein N9V13_01880 [Betaproteobacteria bacterium]|nr:hypothetical protein [Betaproteobacteria bacterium]